MANRKIHESGVISIMVTMILMIVITLIVLGFAEISRSAQRNTLDTQLSVQAYYAAESGINDARSIIMSQLASGGAGNVLPRSTCNDPNDPTLNTNNTIDGPHGVSFTCVLINTSIPALNYQISHTSTVIPLVSGTASSFSKFILKWTPGAGLASSTANCTNGAGVFPPANQWNCNYPVLRIDLVDANGVLSRGNWAGTTETMFLSPVAGAGTGNINFTAGGYTGTVPCSAGTGTCNVNINNLGGSRTFYMRVSTLYRDNSQLTITNGTGTTFTGAQATIDATGQAQDVLRRILVAIDLSNTNTSPVAAITSRDAVCKRFQVTGNKYFAVPSDADGMNNAVDASGAPVALCVNQSSGTP